LACPIFWEYPIQNKKLASQLEEVRMIKKRNSILDEIEEKGRNSLGSTGYNDFLKCGNTNANGFILEPACEGRLILLQLLRRRMGHWLQS